jgi:hypothetical protein
VDPCGGTSIEADEDVVRRFTEDPVRRAAWHLGPVPDRLVLRHVRTARGVRVTARSGPARGGPLLRGIRSAALAWSLDRLRLWVERGTRPGRAAARWAGEVALRTAVAVLWVQGELLLALLEPLAPYLGGTLVYGYLALSPVVVLLCLFAPMLPGTPSARRAPRHDGTRTAVVPRLR